jgi:hypothetical protein
MSKIKYINCFGTSFTAGGGFEFGCKWPDRTNILNNFYSKYESELTQFRFSYPGQLEKLIDNNIVLTNYGKNGYGNDRMYRQVYEIVNNPDFNKEEHIFLIEFAGMGRREYWFNPLNDYIVSNYWFDWEMGDFKNRVDLANSYCYDTKETGEILEKYEPMFVEFFKNTLKLENEEQFVLQNIEFFSSYLKEKQLNYFYVTSKNNSYDNINFLFGDGVYFEKSTDFTRFSAYNKLSIRNETEGIHKDDHGGYICNKIIAMTIYNKLVDLKLLTTKKIDINWKELKEFKLKSII